MTDIVPIADHRPAMLSPSSYDEAYRLAQRIAGTSFVPEGLRNDPNAVLAAILWGGEAGIGAIQALNGIDVIKGKVSPKAELMRALVLRAGHTLSIEELGDERCTIYGARREGTADMRVTWTVEQARKAGIVGGSGWQKYPRAMLLARASSEICRGIFGDVVAGLGYTPDEAAEITHGEWAPDEDDVAVAEAVEVAGPPLPAEDDPDIVDAELVEDEPTPDPVDTDTEPALPLVDAVAEVVDDIDVKALRSQVVKAMTTIPTRHKPAFHEWRRAEGIPTVAMSYTPEQCRAVLARIAEGFDA